MEISAMIDNQQKESPAKPVAGDVISSNQNTTTSEDRRSGDPTKIARKDPRAAQKLARKKRMKAAHRRRLKASHAKG